MALMETTFYANSLQRLTAMTVILPVEKPQMMTEQQRARCSGPMPVLMLLHGFSGIHTDWLYGSRIQELAQQYHVAVLCPDGENAFYLDDDTRDARYEQFLCEVVTFARDTFHLPAERALTTIGGFSMGGYGALVNGLKHPELYGGIIALSAALITDELAQMDEYAANPIASAAYYEHIFGRPQQLRGSDRDPKALVDRLLAEEKPLPRIFLACGTEDSLIRNNTDFSAYLQEKGVPHTFAPAAGIHNWAFWDAAIEKAMKLFYGAAND